MECQTWPLGLVGFAIPEHCDIQVHRVHLTCQLRISRIPSDTETSETSETCPKDCRFETIQNSKPFNHFCPNAPLQSANIIAPPCGQCSSPPWIPAQCCHRLRELRDSRGEMLALDTAFSGLASSFLVFSHSFGRIM